MMDVYWTAVTEILYERAWHTAPTTFAAAHLPAWEELNEPAKEAFIELVRTAHTLPKS